MAGLIDYIKEFYAGGEKPRALVSGLLGGDTTELQNALASIKQLADPAYMRNVKPISNQEAMDIGMFALTSGGNVKDALRQKTQYELAHEIAQKNAVDMLGLPPNNTAMDRAKALGFDTPAYHGTSADFNEFSLSKVGSNYKRLDNPPPTIYAGVGQVGRDVANAYGTNGIVYPLKIKNYKLVGADTEAGIGNYEALIRNPSNIRSRFAAFDPARVNEADLLGMATPEMLGLLAVGSGGGIAYANKKKKGGNK